MGLSLQVDGMVRYYVFNSLPFGLDTGEGKLRAASLRVREFASLCVCV